MNKDIRVATSFPRHPKTVKLRARLGADGVLSLISLWAFAGEYRPKGVLSKLTDEDIAIAANWRGDRKEFVETLLEIGWIDRTKRGLVLHDWEDHNGFAFHAEERTKRARKAAKAKWKNERSKQK